jgi:hypothetical protein
MTDARLAAELAAIRERERAATRGPWEGEDDEDCWRLFGATGTGLHPLQILKAPKRGTPYAEYWPREDDAKFIVAARSDVPSLLAAVEAVLKLAGQLIPQAPSYSALAEDRMWIRQECADMIHAAIASALLGEVRDD